MRYTVGRRDVALNLPLWRQGGIAMIFCGQSRKDMMPKGLICRLFPAGNRHFVELGANDKMEFPAGNRPVCARMRIEITFQLRKNIELAKLRETTTQLAYR